MADAKITSASLYGSLGAKLWPLSRKNFPKLFVHLGDNKSLLQLAQGRVAQINSTRLSPEVICITAAGNCQERR